MGLTVSALSILPAVGWVRDAPPVMVAVWLRQLEAATGGASNIFDLCGLSATDACDSG